MDAITAWLDGHDVNELMPKGIALIHQMHTTKELKFLLDQKADPNLQSKQGSTALQFLADSKSDDAVPCIQLLCAHGADPNYFRPHRASALSRAVRRGRTEIVRTLLECRADANILTWMTEPTVISFPTTPMEYIWKGPFFDETDRAHMRALVYSGRAHPWVMQPNCRLSDFEKMLPSAEQLAERAARGLSTEGTVSLMSTACRREMLRNFLNPFGRRSAVTVARGRDLWEPRLMHFLLQLSGLVVTFSKKRDREEE